MKELLEFAGAHPFVTVLLTIFVLHTPVAIIQALKNKNETDD